MAALRIFARTVISVPRELHKTRLTNNYIVLPIIQISKRWASFTSSPKFDPETQYTDYEISKDPKEWSFVEWYLADKYIPKPKKEENLPSGWKPPKEIAKNLPYFIHRSKNHMQSVYLVRRNRGLRRLTVIRKIEGDICALEADLKIYLQKVSGKHIGSQISEPGGVVKFRGDYVSRVRDWMDIHGF